MDRHDDGNDNGNGYLRCTSVILQVILNVWGEGDIKAPL